MSGRGTQGGTYPCVTGRLGLVQSQPRYLDGPYPRAFAHRGWHCGELEGMENSLPAFRRACAEGFRYLETDVHVTSDGVAVVHHDPLLDRTTDRTGEIATLPWQQVRQAAINGVEPVSRLEDLLEELPDALLNIDVKTDGAVEPVLAVLRRTDAWHRVCLAAFSDRRLARIRALAGRDVTTSLGRHGIEVLWLAARAPLPLRRLVAGRMAQVPVYHRNLTVADHRLARKAHRYGCEVHVWTVDDVTEMRRLLDAGVDGVISDRPDLLREVLRERDLWPERV